MIMFHLEGLWSVLRHIGVDMFLIISYEVHLETVIVCLSVSQTMIWLIYFLTTRQTVEWMVVEWIENEK